MQENRTQDADEHGRSLRPWPVARGAEAPVDLSQNTHGLVCYIPPPSCPSISGASRPVADHHSPWRLSLHAVSPSACVCVYGHDDFLPPPPFPGLSIRVGWAGRMAAFRDCSLARAAVVLCCDRLSRRLRLICVFACLLISARLVKSLSFSLYCFASLLLYSFVSHPSTWWLLLSHNSSLVLHPEASSAAGELLPASVSGWRRAEGLLSLLTLSSPSFGRP